jgi:hypothetical protein
MADREKEAFFDLGFKYYVTARFSAFAYFAPVSGNLFHHAIEMFLKGYLAPGKSLAQLKQAGHKLASLWVSFKQEARDPALDRFDQTVSDLDQFESIRYPDRILSHGMRSFISIKHHHVDSGQSSLSPASKQQVVASGQSWSFNPPQSLPRPEPKYQIVVKEIDELVALIFDKASVNREFYACSLPVEAKQYLTKDNEINWE